MKVTTNECPVVTIVTVVLNAETLIEKTIDSVRRQDYENKEFIIIDGGSCDKTVKIIRDNIDCVTKFINEKDEGIYDAMNKGINLASSDSQYIIFLNSGDVFEDDNVICDVIDNISDNHSHIYGNFEINNRGINTTEKLNQYFLSTNMICHQAFFFNTERHRKFLYDTKYKISADYKLLVEFVRSGEKFIKINRTLVKFDSGGVSQKNRLQLHVEKKNIRKKYPSLYLYYLFKTFYKKLVHSF